MTLTISRFTFEITLRTLFIEAGKLFSLFATFEAPIGLPRCSVEKHEVGRGMAVYLGPLWITASY